MDESIRDLIFQAIDQTISEQNFERLQDAIEQSEDVRLEYLRSVTIVESLSEIAAESPDGEALQKDEAATPIQAPEFDSRNVTAWRFSAGQLAIAATILIFMSAIAFRFGQENVSSDATDLASDVARADEAKESLIAGHATLRRSVDLKWFGDAASYREGDVLPAGVLRFDEGVAEIDFFSGATLIVEGPAALDLESDWSVRVISGRLRANVPPAARGFVVKAAGSEIVDLGTEFALEVGSENARVEVIDGEVELRGGEHDGNHLLTGQRQWLKGTARPAAFEGLSTVDDLQHRSDDAAALRFADWKQHSQQLSTDERLIAYHPITGTQSERVVRNSSSTGGDLDGTLIGPVDRTTGRFGVESAGLAFERPGARVRTRIDGEFQAFTFACWAGIDSLEHIYNALFMSDGYETGELHWQIHKDGRLMFSVMVDDTKSIRHFSKIEQRHVETAGLAHIYYSKPIWDVSRSGQWFHIAAVYDPVGRRVVQYVNGEQVSSEEIADRFHITKLRIGPAEIGKWGQPSRRTPWFLVRNLNGTIDELAIFRAVLSADEIEKLYEKGKPPGY